MAVRVKLRSLTVDDGEGRHGYEVFKIKDGVATVYPETAQAMLADQPGLWAKMDDNSKDVKRAQAVARREARDDDKEQRELMEQQEEQIAPFPQEGE